MSTRGAIARVNGDGFKGVYHHWDSYPKGLGRTLYRLYQTRFHGNLDGMLNLLIDQHPAGWSTINGADFDLAPGWRDKTDGPCATCGKPHWQHYYQEWKSHHKPLTEKARVCIALGNYRALGHTYEQVRTNQAQCYCHGQRHEEANEINERNASGCGVEWVYAFNKLGQMVVLASINEDGGKMIGAFGMGNPKAGWRIVAFVDLDAPEPDWETIENYDSAPTEGQ